MRRICQSLQSSLARAFGDFPHDHSQRRKLLQLFYALGIVLILGGQFFLLKDDD